MADYCSNKVEFLGENSERAMEHFSSMGYDSPPFYDILIDPEGIYFESRWSPPFNDLIEIAETFDVDFQLSYRPPNERAKEKYHYICLKNEKLDGPAESLRKLIFAAVSLDQLEKVETDLHEKAELTAIDSHQREVLTKLVGKRSDEILSAGRGTTDEIPPPGRKVGR